MNNKRLGRLTPKRHIMQREQGMIPNNPSINAKRSRIKIIKDGLKDFREIKEVIK